MTIFGRNLTLKKLETILAYLQKKTYWATLNIKEVIVLSGY